jgi:hypothetical protein
MHHKVRSSQRRDIQDLERARWLAQRDRSPHVAAHQGADNDCCPGCAPAGGSAGNPGPITVCTVGYTQLETVCRSMNRLAMVFRADDANARQRRPRSIYRSYGKLDIAWENVTASVPLTWRSF